MDRVCLDFLEAWRVTLPCQYSGMLVLPSCLEWFQFRSGLLNLEVLTFWELRHSLLWRGGLSWTL